MKLQRPIFITLMITGSLVFWRPALAPLLAQQKETRISESAVAETIAAASPKDLKVMREFRGISLGMKRNAVRDALGKPEISELGKDRFKLGGDDRITIHYDNDDVKVIQLYFFKSNKSPKWADVVGNTEVEQRTDGSKLARVDIPEEKFWVSMYESKSGDVITVNISRLPN